MSAELNSCHGRAAEGEDRRPVAWGHDSGPRFVVTTPFFRPGQRTRFAGQVAVALPAMGYAADYFSAEVDHWLNEGWLKPGSRLIEFGGQEFYCDRDEAGRHIEQFLRRRGMPEERIKAAIGTNEKLSIAAVYRALGIDYSSIDVDGKYGSTFFDLNSFAPPLEWRAAFDFVNNEGTIEHLVNPVNGFQVAHELLKVGGIARHSIPLTGHREHGLVYPTIKFYTLIVGQNHYHLLRSDISIKQSELDFVDPRFRILLISH
jgi:SAM-dependent methyltransferase